MDVLARISRLLDWTEEARTVPFSTSAMINRDAFADELEALRDELPAEIREAQLLIAERDDVLARAQREADRIAAAAEAERQQRVEDADVYREAQRQAEDLLAEARSRARQLRMEADDYIDEKLAGFEIVLHKTLATVERGRGRLARRLGGDEAGEPASGDQASWIPAGDDPSGAAGEGGQSPHEPEGHRPLYDHEA